MNLKMFPILGRAQLEVCILKMTVLGAWWGAGTL